MLSEQTMDTRTNGRPEPAKGSGASREMAIHQTTNGGVIEVMRSHQHDQSLRFKLCTTFVINNWCTMTGGATNFYTVGETA